MQRLVGDDVVQDERDDFRRVELRRDRDELLFGHEHIFGVAAVDGQRGHAVARFGLGDTRADGVHLADDSIARREGEFGREGRAAVARLDIGE